MMEPINFESLKSKQMGILGSVPDEFVLRANRAISWIGRAEKASDDDDIKFLCIWIAFNAAYANQSEFSGAEHSNRIIVEEFFNRLTGLDRQNVIYNAIWDQFSESVRLLMGNRYLFGPFWSYTFGEIDEQDWRRRFRNERMRFNRAFSSKRTGRVLSLLFRRLNLLRNQIIHGSATYRSSKNRDQVRDGTAILEVLVPIFIDIMLDNPEEEWGDPYYPVVD